MLSKKTRIIRALIGLTIMIAGVVFNSWWGLVGLVPFIVGVTGFCRLLIFKPLFAKALNLAAACGLLRTEARSAINFNGEAGEL